MQVSIYSLLLFSICMVCHGELFRLKPETDLLTSYYLHIGFGGALGSVFVAVVAPLIFDGYWEFYLGLLGSYLVLLTLFSSTTNRVGLAYRSHAFRLYLAGGIALIVCLGVKLRSDHEYVVSSTRNFYGRLRIIDIPFVEGLTLRKIKSGTISHGTQILLDSRQHVPTTYFGPSSGAGKMFQHLHFTAHATRPVKAGFIGLGCGTLAAYGRPGDAFTFYEIDPQVVRTAEEYFSYLKDSKARVEHRLGDARFLLERERAQSGSNRFDAFFVDAFYGDTPPIHLLTHEAISLYFDHLKESAYLALNISNLYLDMVPVMRTIAKKMGIEAFVVYDKVTEKTKYLYNDSTWMILTRDRALKVSPLFKNNYSMMIATADEIHWTDDLSSIYSILK